ncbi:restriction endonuclease subunit S [Lactobacillus delbrueckii subsp. lactis]|uniref:restriction endonuclease subunit S n=4 Tax=Lactobacillus delbrueckii TaxID=1584 RepID=UPI001E4E58E9|nr:restriction endonuclease subunit S [Lactobacillus delbrueckii]MCD5494514.1 restriction endonuclease subunit S [Lactobacillus delbrueckii subsp. lactis]MCD5515821.1 restriction endonuclease subunit S [Lactobacillus delbrueckii subsp. lactis]MCD5600666.1 restriction endonuclease subunit S [Lactobacillus delbrueckii subsp. lactis]
MKDEKKAPKLRFKGFTDDWEQCKLKNKAEIVRGASPRPISNPKWFDDNSNVGWLRISDVTEQKGRIHHLSQHISKAGQSKTRVITEPHLLLSIAATVGSPVINYVNTGVHDGFLIFLNPTFNKEFMFQWLLMFKPYWNKYGQPGSQVNLNSDIVGNQSVAFPTTSEQERIANFFSELDTAITLHEEKKQQLKCLKSALLQKMFAYKSGYPAIRFEGFSDEWEQCKLGDVADRFDNLRVPVIANLRKNGDTPYYGANGIQDYVDGYTHDGEYILVAEDGANNLKNYPINYVSGRIWVNNHAHVLQAIPYLASTRFLGYEIGRSNIVSLLVGGGRAKLNADALMNMNLNLPKIKEQELIADLFQKVEISITLQNYKLDKLKNLKSSLLKKMFI